MTKTKELIEKLNKEVLPLAAQFGLELVETEYVKEDGNWYLRVYVDKEGGVTIDDCSDLSLKVSDMLDKTDPIKETYILEVSSPGFDRPLKNERDFQRYTGEVVEVGLYKPLDGSKHFEGALKGLVDGKVVIVDDDGNEQAFERKDVSIVKRKIIF